MPNLNRKKIIFIFMLICFLMLLLSACSAQGKSITVMGTETKIYYDGKDVTKEDAEALGATMLKNDYLDIDDVERAFMLAKDNDVWQFKMIIDSSLLNNPENDFLFGATASQMSREHFNDEKVEIHLCDDSFNTRKVIQMIPGYYIDGMEIYYNDQLVRKIEAEKLGTFLYKEGYSDGTRYQYFLTKDDKTWQFLMPYNDLSVLDDEDMRALFSITASTYSRDIFNNEPVEIHVTDEFIKVIEIFPIAQGMERLHLVDDTEFFYDGVNVTEEDILKLGSYLQENEFTEGTPKSIMLAKDGDLWQFRMVVLEELWFDDEIMEIFADIAKTLSNNVFNSEPVEMHLCNAYLITKNIIQSE